VVVLNFGVVGFELGVQEYPYDRHEMNIMHVESGMT